MSEINVTPLVDVMLVLLVIFIITAPLMTGALQMDLPRVDAAPMPSQQAALEVAIDSSGALFLDGQAIELKQLGSALNLRAKSPATLALQLRADRQVPYGRVAEVMVEIQKSQLHSVSLAVQTPAPKIQASSPPLRP